MRKVLVAGAQGVIGRAAAIRLAAQPDTEVLALSRRTEPAIPGVAPVAVDLLNPHQVQAVLGHIATSPISSSAPTSRRRPPRRKAPSTSPSCAISSTSSRPTRPGFGHVTFYQGGKAYGADLGPFKTPAREDDPRLMPPNFYYDQEDLLRERAEGQVLDLHGACDPRRFAASPSATR